MKASQGASWKGEDSSMQSINHGDIAFCQRPCLHEAEINTTAFLGRYLFGKNRTKKLKPYYRTLKT